jgi:hypothetical protein
MSEEEETTLLMSQACSCMAGYDMALCTEDRAWTLIHPDHHGDLGILICQSYCACGCWFTRSAVSTWKRVLRERI